MLGRFLRRSSGALALVVLAIAVVGAVAAWATPANNYSVTNLVSDQEGKALTLDPSLVNAWGLAALPTSPWWVADNGTDVSTLYRADGSKVPLTRRRPGGADRPRRERRDELRGDARPGIWPGVVHLLDRDRQDSRLESERAATESLVAADRSKDGAIYKGLAIASTATG